MMTIHELENYLARAKLVRVRVYVGGEAGGHVVLKTTKASVLRWAADRNGYLSLIAEWSAADSALTIGG